jgi:hypothetical protein
MAHPLAGYRVADRASLQYWAGGSLGTEDRGTEMMSIAGVDAALTRIRHRS